ncbi:MAG: TonB-dependent receptor [Proteobacteria bacterium]|nr:TonB-dependent receptor [Pseudomonadota bacterium]
MHQLSSGRAARTGLMLAVASLGAPAWAQALAAAPQTVVVTGAREPLPLADIAADVVVIDAARIAASPADSLADLLRREAGVQLTRNGGPGAASSISIRGAAASGTLVLVDGVRVGSATLGQAELEGISLATIERIEVLRGPASSLWGADGVGGVIQIITRQGKAGTQGGARLALANYAGREASAWASGKSGALDWAASLAREQSDGISAVKPDDRWGNHNPDNDGFERTTVQARLGLQAAPGQRLGASVVAGRHDNQYDATEYPPPDYAPSNAADFRSEARSHSLEAHWRADWTPQWQTLVRATTQLGDTDTGGQLIDSYRTRREGLTAQATWQPQPTQHLTLAAETLRERVSSTAYDDESRRTNSLAVAWAGRHGELATQADLRHDDNSVYGGTTTGRLGLAYTLAPGLRLRGLVGSSFRAPSFNELYYPSYGVTTIQPEKGRSAELGVEHSLGDVSLAATVFHNRVTNLIAYQSDASQCPSGYSYGCAANIGRATLQGMNFTAGWQDSHWDLRAALDLLRARDDATGQRLARRAPHQFSLDARWQDGPWQAGAALLRVAARPDSGITLPAYTQIDISAGWRFAPQWTLEAKVNNLTDRQIEPVRDYQSLGRQGWLILRWAS